jgi:hypothetical protein
MRDAHVLPIWEGTSNVLALEVLGALHEVGGLGVLKAEVHRCADAITYPTLKEITTQADKMLADAESWLARAARHGQAVVEAGARRFAMQVGRALEIALAARHAQWSLDVENDARAAAAARRLAAWTIPLALPDLNTAFALANDTPLPTSDVDTDAEVIVPDITPHEEWGDGIPPPFS